MTTVIVVPASTPATKILSYCWTASLDETIKYWDFSTPELLKTIDVKFSIFSMVSGEGGFGSLLNCQIFCLK